MTYATTADFADRTTHTCYFCKPSGYRVMPPHHALCARCGELILTDVRGDPLNERMEVCPRCDWELWREM